jgi:glucosamine 6-phosphate synthetase-like amidotransferase/phosphosugar isomerase protein
MCGIAGMSIAEGIELDLTGTARLLLAGICERGQDATGIAYHGAGGRVEVTKDSRRLRDLIDEIVVPEHSRAAIMHVREFTKGVPGINDNNHPIRYGQVVGVHNGHLDNDDELFLRYGKPRSTPLIEVDSEAIMMLADHHGDLGVALERVRGSAAAALLYDDEPGRLTLAKRASRTLFVAHGRGVLLFASTREPLSLAQRATGLRLRVEEIRDGTVVEVRDGRITGRRRFRVDHRHVGKRFVTYPPVPEKSLLVRLALASFGG